MNDLLEKLKNIDLEKLYYFYLIFREKSIKQASENYNISMSTLRHTLLMLEVKLDLKLYVSSKKTFIPTEEGKRLFKLCRSLIEVVNTYQKEIQEDQGIPIKQDLIIVTTTTFANYYLPQIIKRFEAAYPHVEFKVFSGPEYFTSLDYDFDIIIAPKINNINLVRKQLGKFIYKFYCSSELKKKLAGVKSPQDLKGQNMLMYSGPHLMDKNIIKNNQIKVVSNSYPFLLNSCGQGMGILSCFSTKVLKSISLEIDIVELFSDYVTEVDYGYFYYNRFTDKHELIEKFFSITSEYLKEIEN